MLNKIVSLLPDALMISGGAALSYGAWLIYQPAGYIVAGILLVVAGVLSARAG